MTITPFVIFPLNEAPSVKLTIRHPVDLDFLTKSEFCADVAGGVTEDIFYGVDGNYSHIQRRAYFESRAAKHGLAVARIDSTYGYRLFGSPTGLEAFRDELRSQLEAQARKYVENAIRVVYPGT